ncbi:putative acyl transferase protein [Eutypa lata UCREL1]|uniref:Putative acyl transferase protein n=1 Tax=Eutypa lata (strain UCR-EL1) TaxID=1287681 RepID=M7SE04_EUTLA|nr:putative acyl transferase protein [Eutypa lata UCREL1]
MPELQVIQLRPKGWENDPADEFLKLAPLDYCVGQVYTNWCLFFKFTDSADRKAIINTLQRGLEVTLGQCRQLCGHVEAHPEGELCFHKKRESTVEFHVQWLDGPEDEGKYPTFADLEDHFFTTQSLGNLDTWCVAPMTYGEKTEAQPTSNPKVSAFKVSFIRGGMVFMMHHHHYANDINGWAGEMYQLAENCAAVWKSPESPTYPPWDPACLDYSPISKPDPEQLVDGPASPPKHPDHKAGQWLLFHLPKSKAAELKKMASPDDGSTQENLDVMLTQVAAVRDKTTLFLRMDSFPPLSNITTDWRDSKPYDADFGFGRPYAFRHPFDTVTNGYVIIYPERTHGGPAGPDEGNEILIGFEKEATESLLGDPEWNGFFEFRGVDGEEKRGAGPVHAI